MAPRDYAAASHREYYLQQVSLRMLKTDALLWSDGICLVSTCNSGLQELTFYKTLN
jgi:hypothetical protein